MSIKDLLYSTDIHNIRTALTILEVDLSLSTVLWKVNTNKDKEDIYFCSKVDLLSIDYIETKGKIIKSKLSKYFSYKSVSYKKKDLFMAKIKQKK